MATSATEQSEETHRIFTNDPLHFKSLVNNIVEVETVHESVPHKGILYTVDPVSETVVLLNQEGDSLKMTMIMAYNVKSIKIVQSSNVPRIPDNLFKEDWARYMSKEAMEKKRLKLKEWLLENQIPIVESGNVLKLADVLTIEPPYGPDQCLSSNEMVLDKILNLVKSVPAE